ncbi:MAG: hypothetical protein WC715_05440 [Patescibacteria group bacterium]|jgi:hypothetical protein
MESPKQEKPPAPTLKNDKEKRDFHNVPSLYLYHSCLALLNDSFGEPLRKNIQVAEDVLKELDGREVKNENIIQLLREAIEYAKKRSESENE